jgi:hypothetical protein
MDESQPLPNTRSMLAALSGGALDWTHIEDDLGTLADFVRLLERLWDYPVVASHPASVFSAAWEELPDDA